MLVIKQGNEHRLTTNIRGQNSNKLFLSTISNSIDAFSQLSIDSN